LEEGTLSSAIQAVENLTGIATTQTGSSRQFVVDLANLVKNLYRGEHQLQQLVTNVGETDKRAAEKEKKAQQWLRPNAFGSIRKDLYINDMKNAALMRQQARDAINTARSSLAYTLRLTDEALKNWEVSDKAEVCPPLRASMEKIASRSLQIDASGALSADQFNNQLIAVAFLMVAAASPDSRDGEPPPETRQPDWDAISLQIQRNEREYRRQNFQAEQRGDPVPYPGYGSEP
jgi:hypothetical protein